MYLRRCFRNKDGRQYAYRVLVELRLADSRWNSSL